MRNLFILCPLRVAYSELSPLSLSKMFEYYTSGSVRVPYGMCTVRPHVCCACVALLVDHVDHVQELAAGGGEYGAAEHPDAAARLALGLLARAAGARRRPQARHRDTRGAHPGRAQVLRLPA